MTSARLRRLALAGLALALSGAAACDRARDTGEQIDPQTAAWRGDSSLLAGKPTILFRVVRGGNGTRAVPVAVGNDNGLQPLSLTNRGWRLLDVSLMQGGATLVPMRFGTALAPATIARGMWEGAPLDTIEGCNVIIPAALVNAPDDAELMASRPWSPGAGKALGSAELESALTSVRTLIAPLEGIPPSMLSRYRREVHVAHTGASEWPTIVATYDDPEVVPDSLRPIAQRPRQFIVVLDRGLYGYKRSYVYSTLGNANAPEKRRFLGFFDANGDGKAELYFGLRSPKWPIVTYALSYGVDAWTETFKFERTRCLR